MFVLDSLTPDTILADECAVLAGCSPEEWLALVDRGEAPAPVGVRHREGVSEWNVTEVLSWRHPDRVYYGKLEGPTLVVSGAHFDSVNDAPRMNAHIMVRNRCLRPTPPRLPFTPS